MSLKLAALAAVLCLAPCATAQDTPQAPDSKPAAATPATTPAPPPAYLADPKFQAAFADAKQLLQHRQVDFAADAYKKANKIANGQCVECLTGIYAVRMDQHDYKAAEAACTALLAVVTNPRDKANAGARLARAQYYQAGDKPKPAQLEAVHATLQQALAANPKNPTALFLDGEVLARLGKLDDSKAAFEQCASCMSPRDPALLRTRHFAENPELSTHKMAPPVVVTALDGTRFNLDAMSGRVVLIDFWATWCGPCNEELPEMKRMAKEFAGQPLVIISVSWDQDPQAWKDFVQKNEMTWVQYRDADKALTNAFGVEAIPHYFTIDSDGVLTSEMVGSGSNVEGKLKKLIARARESQSTPRSTPPLTATSGN